MYITIKNNLISVYSLKKEIGIDDINVYFNGKQLEDNRTLFEYNIKKNDRVQVVKKNRGGRLTGGQIFGYVILLFVYMGILLSGLIPFISFIMSNIIIKSLIIGVDFVKGLLDENNWLHSFMDFIKDTCIPIIRFVSDFGIISIVMYFMTFACVYQLYKEKWGPANICQAFRNCSTLSLIMMMFMTLIYAISNLPTFIERVLTPIFPSFLGGILSGCINIFGRLRSRFIRLMPGSEMMVLLAGLLTTGISYLSKYTFLIDESLKNYIEFYKMFMMNTDYKMTAIEYKFKPILELLFRVEKFEKGEYNLSTNKIPNNGFEKELTTVLEKEISRKQTAYAYIIRGIYESILYVFSKIVFLFDICEASDEEKESVEGNISDIGNILGDIQVYINEIKDKQKIDPNIIQNVDGINFKTKIEKVEKVLSYYQNITDNLKAGEEGRTKIVVVDCIFRILENGVATAFPMILLFIIFFLIFMFIPVGF